MWTAVYVRALREEGLRMTVRQFAARLGVCDRTVSKWQAGTTPRLEGQAILDTVLRQATDEERMRFVAALMAAGIDPIGNVRLCLDGRARVWVDADPPAVHLSTPHGGISLTLDENDPGAAVVLVELADSIATLADKLPRADEPTDPDEWAAEQGTIPLRSPRSDGGRCYDCHPEPAGIARTDRRNDRRCEASRQQERRSVHA